MIITLPNFNPNLIAIGPIAIRWYSLAYIAGILFAWYLLKYFNNKKPIMSTKAWDDWLFWAVMGVVVGGRLGYVLFYNFGYYFHNPLQILAVWRGGMSFHGGLLGVIISMSLFCNKYKINFFKLTDILAVATPVGLFFGRIANFINMELYGRVTHSNFGVIFPNTMDNLPRHPSQLYEAALEGVLLFIILFCLAQLTKIKNKPGILSGLFLAFYGTFRMFLEQFREPDEQIGFLYQFNQASGVTMGQVLSVPIIVAGMVIIAYALANKIDKD